jgi:hypothetical protein
MENLEDTAPKLVAELEAPKANPIVKLAAARALIALDARQTADVLMKHALADSWDIAQLIEPALARWKHVPMNAEWLKRLGDPATRSRVLLLSIQCVGAAEVKDAVGPLKTLALNKQQSPRCADGRGENSGAAQAGTTGRRCPAPGGKRPDCQPRRPSGGGRPVSQTPGAGRRTVIVAVGRGSPNRP